MYLILSNYKNLIIIGNGFDLNLGYITSFKGFVIFCMYYNDLFYKRVNNHPAVLGVRLHKGVRFNSIEDIKNYKEYYEEKKDYENFKFSKCARKYFDRAVLFKKKDCDEILVMFKKMIKESYLIKYYIAIIRDLKSEDEFDKQKWKWSDVENNLLDLCQAFCGDKDETKLRFLNYYKKTRKLRSDILINEFVNTLKKDIDDFKFAFAFYLKYIVQNTNMESDQETIKKYNTRFRDNSTCILNFNYTDFSKVLNGANLYSVHGNVCNGDIVLGIDPLNSNLPSEFDILKKHEMINYEFLKEFDKNEGNIVILGHSLSNVDKYILNKVFDEFNGKVICTYHSPNEMNEKKNRIKAYVDHNNVLYYDISYEWNVIMERIGGIVNWNNILVDNVIED